MLIRPCHIAASCSAHICSSGAASKFEIVYHECGCQTGDIPLQWSAGQPQWVLMMERYTGLLPGKLHQHRARERTADRQQPHSPVGETPEASEASISIIRALKLQMPTHPNCTACKVTVSLGGGACPEACLKALLLCKHGLESLPIRRWDAHCLFPSRVVAVASNLLQDSDSFFIGNFICMIYQALRMHTCMPHLGSVLLLVLTGIRKPTTSWRVSDCAACPCCKPSNGNWLSPLKSSSVTTSCCALHGADPG